jgi:hypothetical protein
MNVHEKATCNIYSDVTFHVRKDIDFFLRGTGETSALAFEKYSWSKYMAFNQYLGFTETPGTYCLYIGQTTDIGKHVYVYFTKGGEFQVKTSEEEEIGATPSWPETCQLLDSFYKREGMTAA